MISGQIREQKETNMAYLTSQAKRQQIKEAVFHGIAPGETVRSSGREMYRIRGSDVHARYCAPSPGYKFNLNRNTLRADYELWICGSAAHWYLIPVGVIRQMYGHPAAYPDRHHAKIRVVTVNINSHRVGYAAPSITLDLEPYFCAPLSAE
jgi:hypothetical protein